jgi:LDH2 family malate/lactate/ureidoglycolate dehydrogenase
MATSEIPYFEIMKAYKDGEPLREHSAVDSMGEFTTDAKAALDFSTSETEPGSNIVPMGGGYKGYYIVFLMEMLTSGLIGMPSSPEMTQEDFIPEEHGSVIIAFNTKAMGTNNKLIKSLEELNQAISSQTPKAGETIRTPGEDNNRKFAESQNQPDLEVDDELLAKIDSLS